MKKSILIKLSLVIILAFSISLGTTLFMIRNRAIEEAKQYARTISELVMDTLTSYMVMGAMDRRDEFLSRIREIEGVKDIRVIRSEEVIKQFGKGSKFEVARDEIEKAVLETGKPLEKLNESLKEVTYRLVIPYKAQPIRGVNCLQCHNAEPGAVLGAISLTMDLSYIRADILKIAILIFLIFLFTFGAIFFFINSLFTKIISFIKEVSREADLVSKGDLNYDVKTDLKYEAEVLNQVLKRSFSKLNEILNSIEDKVMSMVGYGILKTGSALLDTQIMVDELLNIYRFKKVIEKERTRRDVYERIVQVLENRMSLNRFSLYDVQRRKNRIESIYVSGAESWCKDIIFEKATECRVVRTGSDVDSREFPCICPNFKDQKACKEGKLHHYCIPVYMGGSVQSVVQIVYEPEMEPFIKLTIPYVKRYLEEASPILEARAYMDALREQTLRDQLTGLYNRRFLEEFLDKIVAQIKRRGTALGILMIDVDYFKEVNDTYGHDMGDKVLKEVSRIIQRSIRESDIAIRFGGEEFLVLLVDIKEGKSEEIAEKIRKAVEEHRIEGFGIVLEKTVSIGVSEFPMDSDKIWQCIKFADVALYKAKEFGRNRVVRFKPEFWTMENY